MLLLGVGKAVIEGTFGSVGSGIYRSQFRGSAPSLKASLKMLHIFLACGSNH